MQLADMDYFEAIIKTLLEHEGYWVRQSFKVNLTKGEKREIGKPSIPRPEIDLLAYKPEKREVIAIEAKSFLDSPGVRLDSLQEEHAIPTGQYKLFTCDKYRAIVLHRLQQDLQETGMAMPGLSLTLGLVAGNIYQRRSAEIREYMKSRSWFFWSPEDVADRVQALSKKNYENEPATITAKILTRHLH